MRATFDNRLLASLRDHFPSRCTIVTQDYTPSAANEQVPSGETAVAGLVDISCRLGPLIEIRPTDSENRGADVSVIRIARQCKLLGHYSEIQPNVHKAVVDGISYPIVGVESDGSQLTTRMRLEIIQP
jgi:hypothetical protein